MCVGTMDIYVHRLVFGGISHSGVYHVKICPRLSMCLHICVNYGTYYVDIKCVHMILLLIRQSAFRV